MTLSTYILVEVGSYLGNSSVPADMSTIPSPILNAT